MRGIATTGSPRTPKNADFVFDDSGPQSGKIIGTVVDIASKQKVKDFTVDGKSDVRSEEPGKFVLPVRYLMPTEVTIAAPGYASTKFTVAMSENMAEVEQTFEIGRGGSLKGRAVTGPDHKPLARVEVRNVGQRDPGDMREFSVQDKVYTDSDGRFSIQGIAAGTITLQFKPAPPLHDRTAKAEIAEEKQTDMGDVVIGEGGVVTGRLLRVPSQSPLAGEEIRIGRTSFEQPWQTVQTGQDGSFRFEGLGEGWGVVSAPRLKLERRVDLEPNATCEANLYVDGGVVKGRLLYGRKPARGRLTAFAGYGPTAQVAATKETGDDGRFLFPLPKGSYEFKAELPGHSSLVRSGTGVLIEENTEKQQDIVIQSGEVSGVVTDGDGKPVSGAHVTLTIPGSYGSDASADSAQDGTFHMMYVPEGIYAAVAKQRNVGDGIVRDVRVSYDAPRPPITIRIERKALGSIQVTPREEGAGILQSPIIALLRDGVDVDCAQSYSPSTGIWTLRDIPEGEYAVRLSANGYCVQLRPVTVMAGQTQPVDVTLFPARDLTLRVRAVGGKAQARAICTLTPEGGKGGTLQQLTDADGKALFKGLRLGAYHLIVETAEGPRAEQRIDVISCTGTDIVVQ